ncbi:MAG: SGNH/GDSL hydrolase family protein [Rhodothermales bacterium]
MRMNPRLKTLFKGLVAAGLLLVLLGGLEGILRWTGVGQGEQTAFKPLPEQEGYQVLNAAYTRRYFHGRFQPTPAFTPFRTEKPPGSFRVVVLGGSSVAGFPYPFYLGFPSRLQQRLEAYAVGQRIEVVNLGLPNTSSYALWDLKEAVVAQAPDAVIVYTGENEYYGAFGAGSAINTLGRAVWIKRLVLRLKRLVLYRALERLFSWGQPWARHEALFMLKTIEETSIPVGGGVYKAGLAQFEANMGEVLRTFRENGIPVYGGTLVSNLKNQPPYGEEATADYERGDDLLAAGDTLGAHAAYVAARNKDEVRIRAPEAMNEILKKYERDGLLTLVDLQPLAVAPSPHGVEDEWFFHDHVHPAYNGYDAIADAFFEVLKPHPALEARGLRRYSDAHIKPVAFDRGYADVQVAIMKAGAMSSEDEEMSIHSALGIYVSSRNYLDSLLTKTFEGAVSVEDAVQAAIPIARSQGDTLRALLLYRSSLHWRPFDEEALHEAVSFAEVIADTSLLPISEEIITHAINLTGKAAYVSKLASLKLKEHLPDDAAHLVAMAEAQDPDAEGLKSVKARLRAVQERGRQIQ